MIPSLELGYCMIGVSATGSSARFPFGAHGASA